jgi:hypothetical protein
LQQRAWKNPLHCQNELIDSSPRTRFCFIPMYSGSLYLSALSVPTSSVIGNVLNGEIPAHSV